MVFTGDTLFIGGELVLMLTYWPCGVYLMRG